MVSHLFDEFPGSFCYKKAATILFFPPFIVHIANAFYAAAWDLF
jgi:hypothetical protein